MRTVYRVGLVVFAAALAAPVAALDARQWRSQSWEQSSSRAAHDEGYRQGLRAGEDHGRRGQPFNFGFMFEYRRGDRGYRQEFGDRDRYRSDFRLGFEEGYREGYGRFDRRRGWLDRGGQPSWSYGGRGGSSDLAFDNGDNDGYRDGLNDGRHRHRDDPFEKGRYRGGDHGYERWYGPREAYRSNYREGFRSGYERGYRDGWNYR